MSDRVRDRWLAGEVALNAWSTFGGGSAARVLASAGFDAVTVDLQHGEQTLEGLGNVVGEIERAGAVPFVRIGWNDPATVMRALEKLQELLRCVPASWQLPARNNHHGKH